MPPKRAATTSASAQVGAAPKLAKRKAPASVNTNQDPAPRVGAGDFKLDGDDDAQMGGPSREPPLGGIRFPLDQLFGDENSNGPTSATLSGDSKPDLGSLRGYGALGEEELNWADVIKQGYLDKAKMGHGMNGKGKESYVPLGASVKTVEVSRCGLVAIFIPC